MEAQGDLNRPVEPCRCRVPADLAVPDEVQPRASTAPALEPHVWGRRSQLTWSVPKAALVGVLRPSRVPGGGSEEMLTGWRWYQAWSETI